MSYIICCACWIKGKNRLLWSELNWGCCEEFELRELWSLWEQTLSKACVQGGGVEGRVQGNKPDEYLLCARLWIRNNNSNRHFGNIIVRARYFTSLFLVIRAPTPWSGFHYSPNFSEKETQWIIAQSPTAGKWLSPGLNPGLSSSKISVNHCDSASLLWLVLWISYFVKKKKVYRY